MYLYKFFSKEMGCSVWFEASRDSARLLVSYSAPEAGASRDLMSDVCRLELVWAPATPALPASVFYKRVVIGDLAHARMKAKTAPQKVMTMT